MIKCAVCNNEIKVNENSRNRLRVKFCSNKCRNYFNNRNNKGKQNFCIDCGKQINLRSIRCKSCSYKIRDLTEEKNGRWKGGTSQGYQIRIYTDILKQNGINLDICQKCGIIREETAKINIHHIDGNHKNNNFNNLMVVCSKCHAKIHLYSKIKKKCIVCNKEFEIQKHKSNRQFCSNLCSNRYNNHKKIGTGIKIKRICIVCQKEFFTIPANLRKSNCNFCSQKCHYENNKLNGKEWSKKMQQIKKIKKE